MKTCGEINARIKGKQAVAMTAEEINGYVERKGLDTNYNRSYSEAKYATELCPTMCDRYKGLLSIYQGFRLPPSHRYKADEVDGRYRSWRHALTPNLQTMLFARGGSRWRIPMFQFLKLQIDHCIEKYYRCREVKVLPMSWAL